MERRFVGYFYEGGNLLPNYRGFSGRRGPRAGEGSLLSQRVIDEGKNFAREFPKE